MGTVEECRREKEPLNLCTNSQAHHLVAHALKLHGIEHSECFKNWTMEKQRVDSWVVYIWSRQNRATDALKMKLS